MLVTAGSAEKVRACEELGAIRAINYREEDFVEVVKEVTQGHGADVILDMVGGDYIERDLRAAAIDGRIVQIAFLKTSKVEIDLMRLMMRRLTLTGSTLRAQSAEAKARMARAIEEKVWPLIADGKFKPVIDSTFALTDAAAAHARIDDPDHIGKIVLVVESKGPAARERGQRHVWRRTLERAKPELNSRAGSICLEKRQTLYRGLPLHVNLARSRGL